MSTNDRLWIGASTTSTGIEGAAPASTWARFEDLGRAPRSGEGNAFATNHAGDLERLAEHGITTLRLTLEWARLEPAPGKVDGSALEQQLHVLREARAAGVAVWACLHDGPLPGWFAEDEGGFVDVGARTRFWPRFVDRAGEWFEDLVAVWVPMADPVGYAWDGWRTGTRPPGRTAPAPEHAEAQRSALLALGDAWRILQSGARPVAASCSVVPLAPAVRSREPDERDAATAATDALDALLFEPWIAALRDGIVAVPGARPIEVPDLAGACSHVVVAYDHGASVYADGSLGPYPTDARTGPTGWAPWAEGAGLSVRRVADVLPDRTLVLETGIATRAADPLEDEWRCEVLREVLGHVERARADGLDVAGLLHRTAVDGYEWEHGFGVQRGCFDRDRIAKPSARVLAAAAGVTPPES
jgi:beta-glucosidase